jgi:hypothetical protein
MKKVDRTVAQIAAQLLSAHKLGALNEADEQRLVAEAVAKARAIVAKVTGPQR